MYQWRCGEILLESGFLALTLPSQMMKHADSTVRLDTRITAARVPQPVWQPPEVVHGAEYA